MCRQLTLDPNSVFWDEVFGLGFRVEGRVLALGLHDSGPYATTPPLPQQQKQTRKPENTQNLRVANHAVSNYRHNSFGGPPSTSGNVSRTCLEGTISPASGKPNKGK